MNEFGLSFHHLGLAVRTPENALVFVKGLDYEIHPSIYDNFQNVNLILCSHELMPNIEIIFPSDTPGPLDNILKKNSELIYHICYSTMDLEQSLEKIKFINKIIAVTYPKPAILFSNKLVSFYKVIGFGLIEIIEE